MRKSLHILIVVLTLLAMAGVAGAESQGRIIWNAVNDSRVTGYKLYWGVASRSYPNILDAQNNLSLTVSFPDSQPVYIAITAYSPDQESSYSEELTCFTVKAGQGSNGAVAPAGNTMVEAGGSIVYSITPTEGYVVDDVKVDGVSVGSVSSYIFSGVTGCHSISATFKIKPPPIPPPGRPSLGWMQSVMMLLLG